VFRIHIGFGVTSVAVDLAGIALWMAQGATSCRAFMLLRKFVAGHFRRPKTFGAMTLRATAILRCMHGGRFMAVTANKFQTR
jgi:hypothetical protein